MLAQIRTLSSGRNGSSSACTRRNITVSRVHQRERRQPGLTYDQFMEKIGRRFEKADRPRNWLGGEVPFPMNPSFQPPIPISDALRATIYKQYMIDPIKNNDRELARQYHLSIKRVDAILRLKGQEASWIKNKPLQTGFRAGMEVLLGVQQNERSRNGLQDTDIDPLRYDVDEADTLDQEEGRHRARQRYQRMYWESIPEGDSEPVVPVLLQSAQAEAQKSRQEAKEYKSDPSLMPRYAKPLNDKVLVVSEPGRPTVKFVDVGGKFIDVQERHRRMAESQRRARVKAGKRQGKKLG